MSIHVNSSEEFEVYVLKAEMVKLFQQLQSGKLQWILTKLIMFSECCYLENDWIAPDTLQMCSFLLVLVWFLFF